VLICSQLEPEQVQRIAEAAACDVLYEPDLLPTSRFQGDHGGTAPSLTATQHERWSALLAAAEITFDFDWRSPGTMTEAAPLLRWVQATSAGIGAFVQHHGLDGGDLILTTAAGTHADPLAEFAITGALHFVKDVPGLLAAQRERRWQRGVCGQLSGRRATVVGLGSIGRRVAELYSALGLRVTGVGRPGQTYDLPVRVVDTDGLDAELPDTDILVLACPLTAQTTNLIGAARVALLPAGAIVINVARGAVIDEAALTRSLASGHLAGAALDVFTIEPLPDNSPLWDLPNVLLSPHSASTAAQENEVLTDLFIDNLQRYLDGRELRNRYHRERGY
jgi:phosphoglycerate dehydrogenase-like enzyme